MEVLECGLASPANAVQIAKDGLDFCYDHFRFKRAGETKTLRDVLEGDFIETQAEEVQTSIVAVLASTPHLEPSNHTHSPQTHFSNQPKGAGVYRGIRMPVIGSPNGIDEQQQRVLAEVQTSRDLSPSPLSIYLGGGSPCTRVAYRPQGVAPLPSPCRCATTEKKNHGWQCWADSFSA